tara:strand:+ start:1454 stop:1933 length:480 start_codon:yes stop_codon:yes gene_type:complete
MSWQSILKSDFTIKTNFPDADFWLQRKGSDKTVGKPKEKYDEDAMRLNTASKHDIGIKVHGDIDKEHVLEYLWNTYNKRHWEVHSYGSLNLQHIRVDDVKEILNKYEKGEVKNKETMAKIQQSYEKWEKQTESFAKLLLHTPKLSVKGRKILDFLRNRL